MLLCLAVAGQNAYAHRGSPPGAPAGGRVVHGPFYCYESDAAILCRPDGPGSHDPIPARPGIAEGGGPAGWLLVDRSGVVTAVVLDHRPGLDKAVVALLALAIILPGAAGATWSERRIRRIVSGATFVPANGRSFTKSPSDRRKEFFIWRLLGPVALLLWRYRVGPSRTAGTTVVLDVPVKGDFRLVSGSRKAVNRGLLWATPAADPQVIYCGRAKQFVLVRAIWDRRL